MIQRDFESFQDNWIRIDQEFSFSVMYMQCTFYIAFFPPQEIDVNREVLLTGLYTAEYFRTIYVYRKRKASHSYFVLPALTLLYTGTLLQTAVQWFDTFQSMVIYGDTREDIVVTTLGIGGSGKGSKWPVLVVVLITPLQFMITDALLLWRSFQMVGGSLWWMVPATILYTGEVGLCLATIALQIKSFAYPDKATFASNLIYNYIFGSMNMVTAGTSLFFTFIIAYRIIRATSQDTRSRKRYKHILDVLIQSSMLYSISQIASAVVYFLPSPPIPFSTMYTAGVYTQVFATVTTGFAPTLMVHRIATSSSKSNITVTHGLSTTHLSGLEFHHNQSDTMDDMGTVFLQSSGTTDGYQDGREGEIEKTRDNPEAQVIFDHDQLVDANVKTLLHMYIF